MTGVHGGASRSRYAGSKEMTYVRTYSLYWSVPTIGFRPQTSTVWLESYSSRPYESDESGDWMLKSPALLRELSSRRRIGEALLPKNSGTTWSLSSVRPNMSQSMQSRSQAYMTLTVSWKGRGLSGLMVGEGTEGKQPLGIRRR
jgi:hypothetical protein